MIDISAVDISALVGLTAMVLLTLNILMGLLVSTNYNAVKQRPHLELPWPLFKIHNWTGYIAIEVAVLHPVVLLLSHGGISHLRRAFAAPLSRPTAIQRTGRRYVLLSCAGGDHAVFPAQAGIPTLEEGCTTLLISGRPSCSCMVH
jgi:hypothetical protein